VSFGPLRLCGAGAGGLRGVCPGQDDAGPGAQEVERAQRVDGAPQDQGGGGAGRGDGRGDDAHTDVQIGGCEVGRSRTLNVAPWWRLSVQWNEDTMSGSCAELLSPVTRA